MPVTLSLASETASAAVASQDSLAGPSSVLRSIASCQRELARTAVR